MRILHTLGELRTARHELVAPAGLVPTMGYLHAGHISLVERARSECRSVIATLFVNPTQFGPNEDFERYPRDFGRDAEMFDEAGVDLLYAPTTEVVYPPGFSTTVDVGEMANRWEGAHRPGHFRGVATIVTKLFTSTQPDRAYFGEKDYQQLQVIRRLARDLDLPVEVVGCPTVRDVDGLALSSRNAYLTPEQRPHAAAIYRGITRARTAYAAGICAPEQLATEIRDEVEGAGLRIDYVALVDPESLELVDRATGDTRILIAARLGAIRLIDNAPIDLE